MLKILLLCLLLSFGILGCGSGASESTAQFQSVYLTVNPDVTRLEADVLTGNSCSGAGTLSSTGGKYTTESMPLTITSSPYPNSTVQSPIAVTRISINYERYDKNGPVPPLPVQYEPSYIINPGSNITVDVNVATDKLKYDMVDKLMFNLCSDNYWEYYAYITFDFVEEFSGKTSSITKTVKVAFADRNN